MMESPLALRATFPIDRVNLRCTRRCIEKVVEGDIFLKRDQIRGLYS